MSNPLPLDRPKLAKILERLASDKDGEVVTAARTAARMVRASGLLWADVLSLTDKAGPLAAAAARDPRGIYGADFQDFLKEAVERAARGLGEGLRKGARRGRGR